MSAPSLQARQKLAALQYSYVCNLPGKLGAIMHEFDRLRTDADAPQALGELHKLTHQLAGSAGSFGCRDISVAAREYDAFLSQLDPSHSPNRTDMRTLEILFEQLQHVIDSTVATTLHAATDTTDKPNREV
ncbi:MAG: Hpt domain-containing protein [Pseudomonadota bacterium]